MGYDFVFDTIAEMIEVNEEWDKEDKLYYLQEVKLFAEQLEDNLKGGEQ